MEENIYTDLPNIDLGQEISKLQKENQKLTNHIENLETLVKRLADEINTMKNTQAVLTTNISELFKTAKNEIERKDRMIAELRRKLDDLLFRRTDGSKSLFVSRKRDREEDREENLKYDCKKTKTDREENKIRDNKDYEDSLKYDYKKPKNDREEGEIRDDEDYEENLKYDCKKLKTDREETKVRDGKDHEESLKYVCRKSKNDREGSKIRDGKDHEESLKYDSRKPSNDREGSKTRDSKRGSKDDNYYHHDRHKSRDRDSRSKYERYSHSDKSKKSSRDRSRDRGRERKHSHKKYEKYSTDSKKNIEESIDTKNNHSKLESKSKTQNIHSEKKSEVNSSSKDTAIKPEVKIILNQMDLNTYYSKNDNFKVDVKNKTDAVVEKKLEGSISKEKDIKIPKNGSKETNVDKNNTEMENTMHKEKNFGSCIKNEGKLNVSNKDVDKIHNLEEATETLKENNSNNICMETNLEKNTICSTEDAVQVIEKKNVELSDDLPKINNIEENNTCDKNCTEKVIDTSMNKSINDDASNISTIISNTSITNKGPRRRRCVMTIKN